MTKINIVLCEPEIPQNTGTIGRLSVSTDCKLHLIEPLGFSLEDKYLKRAGLDYWQHLNPAIHKDWEAFLAAEKPQRMFFISTHGEKSFFDTEYSIGDYLVFGRESSGLPKEFYEKYQNDMLLLSLDNCWRRINLWA